MPSLSDVKIAYKGVALVLLPLLLSLFFLGLLAWLLQQSEIEAKREARARSVQERTNGLGTCFMEMVSTVGSYVLTSGSSFRQTYKDLLERNEDIRHELELLSANNEEQSKALAKLVKTQARAFEIMNGLMELSDRHDRVELLQVLGMRTELESTVKEFMSEISRFSKLQKDYSKQNKPQASLWKQRIWQVVVGGFIATFLASVLVAVLFARSITARLNLLIANADRLASNSPLLPRLPGRDEVAILDSVFHKMADTLEIAAKRERAIVENAVDVIFSVSANNGFVSVNPAATRIWGYEPAELIGVPIMKVVQEIEQTSRQLDLIRQTHQAGSFENFCLRKDGTSLSMLWSADWSDLEQAFFCVAHDITERKESERLLRESEARVRLIIETMPISLLIVSCTGLIELANSWTEKMFGVPASKLAEQQLSQLLPETANTADLESLMIERFDGKLRETEARTASGDMLPVEVTSKGFAYKEDRKHIVALLDITERHNIQRLKKEFIAMLAHDLRAPLAAVRMCLSLLLDGAYGSLNDAGSSAITKTEGEVERLIQLVNDMLEVERIESGELKLDREVVSIDLIVMKSIDAIAPLAEKAQVQISTMLSPCETLADGHRLIQVIVNLLANAIKFSPPGSTITVTAYETDTAVEVQVADQGRGIPAAMQSTVFDRFRQVENKDATEKGGSGLGLAICKSIVLAHQGEIAVSSEPGKGSTFRFKIPIPD